MRCDHKKKSVPPGTAIILFAALALPLFFVADLHAFSLGPIEIVSQFGEKFDAQIAVTVEDDGDVSAAIGSREDYARLELDRPAIVDELHIEYPAGNTGATRKIRIVSDRPFFYPSFHLVIRAAKGDGVIYENYLVAIDLQQNVSLAVRGEKKKTAPPEKAVAPAPSSAAVAQAPAPDILESPKPPSPPPSKGASPAAADSLEASLFGMLDDWKQNWELGDFERYMSHYHKGKEYEFWRGVKKRMFARHRQVRISIGHPELSRMVGYWSVSFEQHFTSDKMDSTGRKTLELTRAGGEWEILTERFKLKHLVKKAGGDAGESPSASGQVTPALMEVDLPAEAGAVSAGFLPILADWKKSWEEGDLVRHLSRFMNDTDKLPALQEAKKRMFAGHSHVEIHTGPPVAVQMNGRWFVAFEQTFASGKMTSSGRKILELVRQGAEWKIADERFKARHVGEARSAARASPEPVAVAAIPYTVYVSTHPGAAEATGVVNLLRGGGFNAYLSPLYVSAARKVYIVAVDRFADWELAEQAARALRLLEAGHKAVPMKYPYAFELGTYGTDEEAIAAIKTIRAKGLSPYLLRTGGPDFSRVTVKVLAGAYNDRKSAEEGEGDDLERLGVAHKLVTP